MITVGAADWLYVLHQNLTMLTQLNLPPKLPLQNVQPLLDTMQNHLRVFTSSPTDPTRLVVCGSEAIGTPSCRAVNTLTHSTQYLQLRTNSVANFKAPVFVDTYRANYAPRTALLPGVMDTISPDEHKYFYVFRIISQLVRVCQNDPGNSGDNAPLTLVKARINCNSAKYSTNYNAISGVAFNQMGRYYPNGDWSLFMYGVFTTTIGTLLVNPNTGTQTTSGYVECTPNGNLARPDYTYTDTVLPINQIGTEPLAVFNGVTVTKIVLDKTCVVTNTAQTCVIQDVLFLEQLGDTTSVKQMDVQQQHLCGFQRSLLCVEHFSVTVVVSSIVPTINSASAPVPNGIYQNIHTGALNNCSDVILNPTTTRGIAFGVVTLGPYLTASQWWGGRLKAVDFAGVKVELGANWIHGVNSNGTKRNPIWTLANSCGLRMVRGDHASIAAYDSSGDDVTRELPWDEAGSHQGSVLKTSHSLAHWNDTTYQDFGTDLYFITDQRGYVYLVKCLGKDFLDDRHLRLNTRVTSVHHSDTCVVCHDHYSRCQRGCDQGGAVSVVDLPPWKRDAIRGIRFGHFTKIFMLFNETFWDTTVLYIGRALLPAERGYPLFQPLGHLFDHASTTKRQLLAALRSLYPSYRAELLDLLIPDWAEDPLYQGSYSFPGVRRGASHSTLAAPVGNLFFSGEATSENFYGYVHGAYIAGVHTAYAVMSCSRSAGPSAILVQDDLLPCDQKGQPDESLHIRWVWPKQLKILQAMPTSQAAPNVTALNAVTALSNTADPLNPSVPNGIITACNVRQRSTALWKQHAPQLDVRLVVLPMSQHWIVATVQFHAYNPSGILFYQINSVITDFLGVKMHGGLPWLIFDVGSGPAVVGSNRTRTFIDGQWHTGHVVLFEQAFNTFYVTVAPDGFDAVSVQNVGSTYIIVSWDLPTHSNGILINFS
eukprot:Em0024g164a